MWLTVKHLAPNWFKQLWWKLLVAIKIPFARQICPSPPALWLPMVHSHCSLGNCPQVKRRLHQRMPVKGQPSPVGKPVHKMSGFFPQGGTDSAVVYISEFWQKAVSSWVYSSLSASLDPCPSLMPLPLRVQPQKDPSWALLLGGMIQDNNYVCILFSFDS